MGKAMTISDLLAWASDIRKVANEALKLTQGMDLSSFERGQITAGYDKEMDRAIWLDGVALAMLDKQDEASDQAT